MMRYVYLTLVILTFNSLVGCNKNDEQKSQRLPSNKQEGLPPNQLEVDEVEGVVIFYGSDARYAINVFIEGTIDSHITGFVDSLPAAFQEEFLEIIFSGTYSEIENEPSPSLGGQQFYNLKIKNIRKK